MYLMKLWITLGIFIGSLSAFAVNAFTPSLDIVADLGDKALKEQYCFMRSEYGSYIDLQEYKDCLELRHRGAIADEKSYKYDKEPIQEPAL